MSQTRDAPTAPDRASPVLDVAPLSGTLGAEVRGIRLDELGDAGSASLDAVRREHRVTVRGERPAR